MKSLFNLTVCLLLFNSFTHVISQNAETVELSINMDNFTILSASENKYIIESRDRDYFYIDNPDLPALPVKNIPILVPNGAELIDYHFSFEKELINSDIQIDHSPSFVPVLPSKPLKQADFLYSGLYPEQIVQFVSSTTQRGYTQFNFTFSPFIYDGDKKELSLVTHLNLKVEYDIKYSKLSSIHPDENLIQFIRQKIANPEAVDRFYHAEKLSQLKNNTESIDYIIVTKDTLKDYFSPLINWKIRKGLNARIITIEEIEKAYDAPTIQLKIKKCLFDYYSNNDLKWVLLGGDADVVPVQYCYTKVTFEKYEYEDYNIPTDLFYACFDQRFDWNSNNNDKIGEMYLDAHDVTPDIYLTRIPVRTKEDAEAFTDKTLNYELDPSLNNSNNRNLIFAGVKLWSSWDGKSDSHHRSDLIFNNYLDLSRSYKKLDFFDTGTDFIEGPNYDVTANNLSNVINEGFNILHYTGHGYNQSLHMESGKGFDSNDAMNLKNKKAGIIISNACNVNSFDITDPSLSEALLRNPRGGCVAFFGSSRYGFGNPNPSNILGASLRYNAKFINHLFTSNQGHSRSFGEIAARVKAEFIFGNISNGFYHYLLYAINPMGDPELPIYIDQPKTFSNVRIYMMGNSLNVSTGGVQNSTICITSLDINDGYKKVANNTTSHTFQEVPEQFQLTITALDHNPYIFTSGTITGADSEILRSRIKIFPNPVHETLHINFEMPQGKLQIYDLSGRFLKEQDILYGPNNINVSDMPEGLLILKFITEGGIARFKMLKQK